jgi:ElaB/YqjD/DUF883 family membrane-anchored ribosome-binding protein
MARRKKSSNNRVATIEDELNAIAADVASLGSAIGDVASAEAREMIQSIRQRLDRVASEAGYATSAGMEVIQDTIREKPITCVLVGFACGLVTGAILRR